MQRTGAVGRPGAELVTSCDPEGQSGGLGQPRALAPRAGHRKAGPGQVAASRGAGVQHKPLPRRGVLFRALKQRVGWMKKCFSDEIENIFL